MDKIGLEFIDLYRIFEKEVQIERDRADNIPSSQGKPVTPEERIEVTTIALLKVIEANNKAIKADLLYRKE